MTEVVFGDGVDIRGRFALQKVFDVDPWNVYTESARSSMEEFVQLDRRSLAIGPVSGELAPSYRCEIGAECSRVSDPVACLDATHQRLLGEVFCDIVGDGPKVPEYSRTQESAEPSPCGVITSSPSEQQIVFRRG